jgi:hypothetical protein
LELGVPADSADCIFTRFSKDEKWKRRFIEDVVSAQLFCNQDFYFPCWSVGRLMEIAHICSDSTLSYKEEANEIQKFKEEHKCETLIEAVIVCITDAVSIGSINFSKLEE